MKVLLILLTLVAIGSTALFLTMLYTSWNFEVALGWRGWIGDVPTIALDVACVLLWRRPKNTTLNQMQPKQPNYRKHA